MSDHFRSSNDKQGPESVRVEVIGALSEALSLPVTTAVTCPTAHIHPALIAQAAAAAVQLGATSWSALAAAKRSTRAAELAGSSATAIA